MLYSDHPITIQAHHKKLTYLRHKLDTAVGINVIPASVYNKLFHDLSLEMLGSVQANFKVYRSDG